MLNPAAAFIKACKMIYDVVMFFVEKGSQIKEFVDSVLDSVESIAGGGVGAVAGLIEKTLAKTLPLVLGFLASLLGLGGISEKIKTILETVQKPIMSVVDKVIGTAVKYGKKFISGAKALGKKALGKLGLKEDTPEKKQERLDKGVAAGVGAANRFAGKPVSGKLLTPLLAGIKLRYRMAALELVASGERWSVHGRVNPEKESPTSSLVGEDLELILKRLTNPALPELVLALDFLSPQTHAFATYPKTTEHYTNDSGRHAEWNFDQDIRANLLTRIDRRKYREGSTVPVVLRMNRTPCDACISVLDALRGARIHGRTVALTVKSSSPYGGTRWEKYLSENPEQPRVPVPILRSSLEGLASLKARGVKLEVWDIWDQIGRAITAGDPRVQGLDPSLVRRNKRAADLLQGTLGEAARRLAEPSRSH